MLLITTATSSTSSSMLLVCNDDDDKNNNYINHNENSISCWSIRNRNRRLGTLIIPNSTNNKRNRSRRIGQRSWRPKFFLDEDGNWLGFGDDDMLLDQELGEDWESEDEKFEAWKRRAEAITELREPQDDLINEESRSWEDWLHHHSNQGNNLNDWDANTTTNGLNDNDDSINISINHIDDGYPFPLNQQGSLLLRSLKNILLDQDDDDDLLYEDRVFRYASTNSVSFPFPPKTAKFLAVLIIMQCVFDFAVHDYVLMPFFRHICETVPLAAQLLDVRRHQKLEIIEQLKMEKARLRLEIEIGRSPPLSDDQAWWELRNKALELRDEWRLHNRSAFANIWSDMVFGISLFILLYFNQTQVALLKFTGYKIINNISDTGKAFLIILITGTTLNPDGRLWLS